MQLNRRRLLAAGAGSAIALGAPGISFAASRPRLTHGVQSGDVSDRGAVVWTRADRDSQMRVVLSKRPDFKRARTITGPALTEATDFTGNPAVSAFTADEDAGRRAIVTCLTPESRRFCACAWPWLP